MKSSNCQCPNCQKEVERQNLCWTYDRYGIAYKKVCYDCVGVVEKRIGEWIFDPLDAGEQLEPE